MVNEESFGSLVRRYRRNAELSQEALAERAGLSIRAIRDIEAGGRHRPRQETIDLLLDALFIPGDEQGLFLAAAGQLGSAGTAVGDKAVDGLPAPRVAQLLTILIADVRGYTAYTIEHGDAAGAQLAAQFAAITRAVVAQHGGTVLELRGDEALSTFTSARQALRAAVALQERYRQDETGQALPLGVGIGLDAGELVPVETGFRGRALNLAARLCSLARSGDILSSDGVLHLSGSVEGISVVNRGSVALKGLPDPVQVLQVVDAESATAELPPLQAILASHPTNLPDEATPFIGRERETDHIIAMLRDPHIRMVTLTGPGGSGKTRLALHVAATLLHDFRDGVFFVDLAPLSDPSFVPAAIAQALGISEQGGRDLLDSAAEHLERRHLLLVLDNFEHLLDACSVVASLLDGCRELHILVTSRTPLRLSREHEHAVPPLSVPALDRAHDVEGLSRYEAVTLFVERARAAMDSFTLTRENASAVAEICCRLDGLPLAIELAVSRIKLFPPQALLQRLESRLKILTGGARDRPARQQTLRNAIAWSASMLSPEEQRIFARLSVFAGGCTMEAVEAVCASECALDVLDSLTGLVDKSLVQQRGLADEPRFDMLETIREYAGEQLDAQGERDVVQRRHAEYFTAMAEEAGPRLTFDKTVDSRVEREHDNLRAALGWGLRADTELGLRIVGALSRYWEVYGHYTEGRRWIEALLAGCGDGACAPDVRASALLGGGILARRQGDFERSRELCEKSLRIWQKLGDRRATAWTLQNLAYLDWEGDYERARKACEEAVRMWREVDESGIAGALCDLGDVTALQGDYARARVVLEESLQGFREMGAKPFIALVLENLGHTALRQSDCERAREIFEETAGLAEEVGNKVRMAGALLGLAGVAGLRQEHARAAHLLGAWDAALTSMGAAVEPLAQQTLDGVSGAARNALGAEAYEVAYCQGQTMGLEEAVASALAART